MRSERYPEVKTVRFSQLVEKCGRPETHLVLVEPTKDRGLQAAVKVQRVLTVTQVTVGTKTDRGEVGFHPGANRQFLIFPKTLRSFAGRTVVGIKYDLLALPVVPKSQRAAPSRPPKKAPRKAEPKTPPKASPAEAPRKVVAFEPRVEQDEEAEEIAELKKQVRRAMAVLEEGKPVAAFNLLKRIVGD